MNQDSNTIQKREAELPRGVERVRPAKVFMPRADIYETPESLVVVADMPGVDEKSVDITLEKNVLTIYGRVEPWTPTGHGRTYQEYDVGDYQRAFTVSDEINREGISASVRNGVLRLVLPKAGPAQTRKITVRAE